MTPPEQTAAPCGTDHPAPEQGTACGKCATPGCPTCFPAAPAAGSEPAEPAGFGARCRTCDTPASAFLPDEDGHYYCPNGDPARLDCGGHAHTGGVVAGTARAHRLAALRAAAAPEGAEAVEVKRLRGIIEAERSAAAMWIDRIRCEVRRRYGISQSRGPYGWDDEAYMREFGAALEAIDKALDRAARDTRIADRTDCPTTQAEVDAARAARAALSAPRAPEAEAKHPDTARLDWLAERLANGCEDIVLAQDDEDGVWLSAIETGSYLGARALDRSDAPLTNVRDAIDAARSAEVSHV